MSDLHSMSPIVAALITPFTDDDDVNHEALQQVIEHALSLGVRGFYVCGSTGEGLQMSVAERQQVVETVQSVVAGRCGVMVNISHMDIRAAVELGEHAYEQGASAISALPPIYNPVSSEDIRDYLHELMDRTRAPFTIYHVPVLTGRSMSVDEVAMLAKHPHFVGLKYTSDDSLLLARIKDIDEGRLMIWSGRDAYFLSNFAMGADGAVGSSFQLMGDVFNAIAKAYRSGDVQHARNLQTSASQIHARLGRYGPYQSYKACFELMGIAAGRCRRPFRGLPQEANTHLRETLTMLDALRVRYGLEHQS
ncbi:MAG: dihydrodipicolinate synthase family protein [Phycisphaeraceae bacterium]|nr:dihydrodipicolinate synthase family protein [Phycisphaeraceae bacterium]